MAQLNRQWLLKSRPVGMVKESDFEWREAPMPTVADGGVLVRNLWLSFDPAMRGWMEDRESYIPPVGIGEVMRAGSVGQVVESRNPEFKVGDTVQGMLGWQDYAVAAGGGPFGLSKIPEGTEPRLALSLLGCERPVTPWACFTPWTVGPAVPLEEAVDDVVLEPECPRCDSLHGVRGVLPARPGQAQ